MDLSYSEKYQAYQQQVSRFLQDNWDPAKARDKAYVAEFRRRATEAGYIYRSLPKAYGGAEVPPDVIEAQIIRDEFAKVKAPKEMPGNGVMLLVPTLIDQGSEEQKQMFVPKTLSGEYKWAQGYSEPGAGSDLAAVKTKGELIDGEWVINGHKIWTTDAETATHMFALVRTEPDAPTKHAGISYILFRMDQPGVTIRPLKPIYGGHAFCEVILEDVRAPADWLVGERGDGWNVSKSTLKHERNSVGSAAGTLETFEKLVKLARSVERDGVPVIKDPVIREKIGEIEGYVRAHLYSGYYQLTKDSKGEHPGIIGLMNKINNSNIGLKMAELASEIIEDESLIMPVFAKGHRPGNERWVNHILGSLAATIGGGTSNIQMNIIAERGLELPREEVKN